MNGDIRILPGFKTDGHNQQHSSGFKLMVILLHQSPKHWDNRCELLAFSLKSTVLTLRLIGADN